MRFLCLQKRHYLGAILSAVLVALGFPNELFKDIPFDWVLPFSLVPLLLSLASLPKTQLYHSRHAKQNTNYTPGQRALNAFLLIWFFGLILQLLAFFWLSQPILYFTTLSTPLAYSIFALVSLLSALYFPVLFAPLIWATWAYAKKPPRHGHPIIAMALILTLLEIITPRFFHWTFSALMHNITPVNQLASILGFSGASFFIFLSNLIIAHALQKQQKKATHFFLSLATVSAFWLLIICFGQLRVHYIDEELKKAPTSRIAFVQPNYNFNPYASRIVQKGIPNPPHISSLKRLSETAITQALEADGRRPDLLIWPESTLGSSFTLDPANREEIKALSQRLQVPILVQATQWELAGAPHLDKASSTSFLVRPDGSQSQNFRKWLPMPFGETVPLESFIPGLGPLFRSIFRNASKIEIGTTPDTFAYSATTFVAPLICFDSILADLPRQQTLRGNASIFVNQANFVWMAQSNAGFAFSVIDQFRAIENARSLVLVSHTGPSTAFDPLGRTLYPRTALLSEHVGYVDVPIYTGYTPYTFFSDLPLMILGICALLWHSLRLRRKLSSSVR